MKYLLLIASLIACSYAAAPIEAEKTTLATFFAAVGYNNYTATDDCLASANNPAYTCNAAQRVTKVTLGGWNHYAISGTLSTVIGELTELTVFNVSHLDISGEIPSEIGLLSKLTVFQVDDNKLDGTIPGSFTNLNNLDVFEIQLNELDGHLPPNFKANLLNISTCTLAIGNAGHGEGNKFCCTDNQNPDSIIAPGCDGDGQFDWDVDCDKTCTDIGFVYTPAPTPCTIDYGKCDAVCGGRDNVESCTCAGTTTTEKCLVKQRN